MTPVRFDPPGGLSDLDQAGRDAWHGWMSSCMDESIAGDDGQANDSPRGQFLNLAKTEPSGDALTKTVTWLAFPRRVRVATVTDKSRWESADASRDVQDEYCEWSVTRGPGGKIEKVTFTCEGPEYWDLLAKTRPDVVLGLYQTHVDPGVARDDLFDSKGAYIPRNKWNTTTTGGAMHLVQRNNTLWAEIDLAASASIVRVIGGRALTGEQELIACGNYGQPERNSDPHIGGSINEVARLKAFIALANPVGLYFDGLHAPGWETPDGSDPLSYWKFTRGTPENPVRAVYEVPKEKGFSAGDITIYGKPIEFGSQMADCISMKVTALAYGAGQCQVPPMTACASPAAAVAAPRAPRGNRRRD